MTVRNTAPQNKAGTAQTGIAVMAQNINGRPRFLEINRFPKKYLV